MHCAALRQSIVTSLYCIDNNNLFSKAQISLPPRHLSLPSGRDIDMTDIPGRHSRLPAGIMEGERSCCRTLKKRDFHLPQGGTRNDSTTSFIFLSLRGAQRRSNLIFHSKRTVRIEFCNTLGTRLARLWWACPPVIVEEIHLQLNHKKTIPPCRTHSPPSRGQVSWERQSKENAFEFSIWISEENP